MTCSERRRSGIFANAGEEKKTKIETGVLKHNRTTSFSCCDFEASIDPTVPRFQPGCDILELVSKSGSRA
jgi:hypothetical protein